MAKPKTEAEILFLAASTCGGEMAPAIHWKPANIMERVAIKAAPAIITGKSQPRKLRKPPVAHSGTGTGELPVMFASTAAKTEIGLAKTADVIKK
ncbi:MAG: hypothetical protein A2931_01135 [Candidatus Niyogibacteria bacterium RIFCSPLOWO2_01_FULL_45_48]|uniref:Uncharacterized protein n=2 Tax=Candidatus Niyogiibacteriota TaxID=1817912 RepID=A0A1G2EXN1_9BACT|nr:MAG: hypothetical protein A2931_01135 [Candidatus Niyogibacteria bacterium RIFCSPLOWO2_01_FULL_45_48]OGZ30129.1 MAG: hypothetical protein A2835_00790 [Candidatus Niyogibacteria bacterium RIFCSPHIGHO2_01_FULL_45_28]OGZ30477.1 MAG: hypothetical protein A3J00_04380 [Candidatus Niyogibacteria bacterium RIFCSPLOWO2_02_FULL_45_13]